MNEINKHHSTAALECKLC